MHSPEWESADGGEGLPLRPQAGSRYSLRDCSPLLGCEASDFLSKVALVLQAG